MVHSYGVELCDIAYKFALGREETEGSPEIKREDFICALEYLGIPIPCDDSQEEELTSDTK